MFCWVPFAFLSPSLLSISVDYVSAQNLIGASDSIYSLCMNPTATVCIAGTSEMVSLFHFKFTYEFYLSLFKFKVS